MILRIILDILLYQNTVLHITSKVVGLIKDQVFNDLNGK